MARDLNSILKMASDYMGRAKDTVQDEAQELSASARKRAEKEQKKKKGGSFAGKLVKGMVVAAAARYITKKMRK